MLRRRRRGLSPERLWTIFAYLPRPLEVWGVDVEWYDEACERIRRVRASILARRPDIAADTAAPLA